jgi:Na+-translocating ferredoxin:NAD+ oxidoreductase RnfE subunit
MTAVSEKRNLIPITIGLAVFVYVIAGIINLRDLFLLNNYSPAVIIMRD